MIVISLWHYLLYVQIYPGGVQGNYSSNSIILAIATRFILPCDVDDFDAVDIRLTVCNHPFISIFSFSILMTSSWNYVTWNIKIDKIMIVIAMTKTTEAITINKNKALIQLQGLISNYIIRRMCPLIWQESCFIHYLQ